YLKIIKRIEPKFGDLPTQALEDPRVTRDFLDWRDSMASNAKWADYSWTVLMRVISWGRSRGLTTYRPPERIDRLYHADRSEMIWSEEQLAAFLATASKPLQLAMTMAVYTGQRQADLLAITWTAYDGQWIRFRQSTSRGKKSRLGKLVSIPVHSRLKAVLDATPKRALAILTNVSGRPWNGNTFRDAWRRTAVKSGIELGTLTFHDLRGTA